MMAWGAAGVSMPHYSGAQYEMFPHVPLDQLEPGDLLFWGPGGSEHVAMYIGGGMQIAATHTGDYVRIQPEGNDPVGRGAADLARRARHGPRRPAMSAIPSRPYMPGYGMLPADRGHRPAALVVGRGALALVARLLARVDSTRRPATPHAGLGRVGRRRTVVQQRQPIAQGGEPALAIPVARSRPTPRPSP